MQVRSRSNRRNRSSIDPSQRPVGTSAVAVNAVATNKWRMTFNVPVLVQALPLNFKVNGASPTGYTVVAPTIVDLAFAVNVAAGQTFLIPANDSAIRTSSGGYVAASGGTF